MLTIKRLCTLFASITCLLVSSMVGATTDITTLSKVAHDFLLEQAQTIPGQAQVHIDSSRLREQAACSDIQAFFTSGTRLRTRMSIGLRCLNPTSPWTTSVPATLSIQGFYYVSNRTIALGETISLDDLVAREGDLLRLPNGALSDPSQIIGFVASQRINSGSLIRQNTLRDPQAIVRGQAVRTIARGIGFVISGEGQALQTGSPGSQIQVRVSSGQVISATVLDSSTVQVLM
ncbi:flagellar basal body P-ring formation protein FlgA [Alcaligenes endophyticus]|uniref:Flagella basal body P-ring formation protein FlgA n=2 Tax=Alcaligenes endophyticus TaxID=1929088 RepID=A0ABT8ELB9_9BURK|nr:flagellar basal body P-ring formation protein FlgA [Alcaligenes endophyticus]